jgi:hypothetical protein
MSATSVRRDKAALSGGGKVLRRPLQQKSGRAASVRPLVRDMRVAVGTVIADRPPHRSRRALLTHRAPPSGQTSAARGLKPDALRRTAANRIDVVTRLSVRTTAACRLFPSGEALPSMTSAGSCLPLFGRFLGTTTSSDFSHAYMLGVRLLPSRAGPAQVRARVRPPRFRAKNFSTCARSPTARGSSHASQYVMGRCCLLVSELDRHLGIRPVSQLNTRPVVSPVNASRLPSRAEPRASLGVGVVG